MKQAALFVNLGSRRGGEWFDAAKSALEKDGFRLVQALSSRDLGDIEQGVKKAVYDETPLVIVGGGDGTLGSLAKLFMDSKTVLGVLPMGTGNSFARDLGIRAEVNAAVQVMSQGKIARVDTGTIDGQCFLNVASIGLSTRIAAALPPFMKKRLGRFAYGLALSRALINLKPFLVHLITPDGDDEFEAFEVVIGAGRYHAGPFPLSPDSSITDGKLNVYAVCDCSRAALIKYALFLPGGYHTKLREVTSAAVTKGRIETSPRRRVTVDGEIRCETPFNFGICAGCLQVMVPPEFKG